MKAQTSHQVLSASGGDATGSGGSVAYSVGQIVYTTSTGTTGSVAQGVEQAYEIYSVGIKETTLNISLSVFPNPTNGDFTITGLELVGTVSSLTLTDMNGKVVKVLDTKATKFSMASIKPGVYFLNIISGNKQEVLKIVKE